MGISGVFGVKISYMTSAPERLRLRPVLRSEVLSLKNVLREERSETYANLFVGVINSGHSRESLIAQLEKKTQEVTLLGGESSSDFRNINFLLDSNCQTKTTLFGKNIKVNLL